MSKNIINAGNNRLIFPPETRFVKTMNHRWGEEYTVVIDGHNIGRLERKYSSPADKEYFYPKSNVNISMPQLHNNFRSGNKNMHTVRSHLIYLKILVTLLLYLFTGTMVLWLFDVFSNQVQKNLTGIFVLMVLSSIVMRVARISLRKRAS